MNDQPKLRLLPVALLTLACVLTACGGLEVDSTESVGQKTAAPEPTATSTPTPAPTNTPLPAALPESVFAATDPAGDAYLCESGAAVDDSAVDIHSVMVFDPPVWGSDYEGWLARVSLGAPANQTFANDWSASLLGAYAAEGAAAFTVTVNEIHAGAVTAGIFDESGQAILPGTADRTYIDDQGSIWFLIPRDTTFLQFASFHLPTEDLPPDQKRCDVAPDDGPYTLDLP